MISYGHQCIDEDDIAAVARALRGDLITTGPWVERFESDLADTCTSQFAIAVNSGTAALQCAYSAAGVRKGTKVITSPLTFVATANAALRLGAEVAFADIDPETGCIDPASVEALLDETVRVVAAVDYAGHCSDYDALRALQTRHPFVLVADACHSLGGMYKGRRVGALADITCFSFHPVKAITTGEGGAVITNDPAFARHMRAYRTHGIVRDPHVMAKQGGWFYSMERLGCNFRMSDIAAALGYSQLRKLPQFIAQRRETAHAYNDAFADATAFTIPVERENVQHAYHLYPIRLRDASRRRDVFDTMHRNGVSVQVHYIPVYLQPYYAALGYKPGLCPKSEAFYAAEISLPVFPGLSRSDQDKIISVLNNVHA